MNNLLVNRQEEQKILYKALKSNEPEMIALVGRKYVGKTFLVKSTYQKRITFQVTGLQNGDKQAQIQNFNSTLLKHGAKERDISYDNWLEMFQHLVLFLDKKPKTIKQIIFLDELPWLANYQEDILTGLSFFWNSWAVNNNVILIVSGSSASWMRQKVINNTGGLYGRTTKRIFLKPFNLRETEKYFIHRGMNFSRLQIAELYMIFGGIPYYLQEIKRDKNIAQNIDDICFSNQGLLCNEFSELYSTIFEDAKDQIDVVHNLNRKLEGLTSSYLAAKSEALPEDDIISILKELEQSDFVSSHYPFSEKREGILFRLSDEYSLFYLQFLGNNNSKDVRNWEDYTQTERYKEWSEYAFQNLCLKHIPQIKKAIGIGKAYSRTSNFYKKGTKIELLIDRANGIISICEIKFSKTKLDFDSNMRAEMSRKLSTFQQETKTTQYLQRVIITALGIEHYKQWRGSIDKRVTLDDLFSN